MSQQQIKDADPMKKISISKVVINIGVGKSGEPIEKAKRALHELTGQQPSVRGARETVRDFGIHKGEPIGAMVTLRREQAIEFLKRVISAKGNALKMDVSLSLTRPGYRIAKKRHNQKIGKAHRITRDEAIKFFQQQYGVEIA